jgi:hypothetical protein
MSKGNLGIVKETKDEDPRAKNAELQTHTTPTPERKPDTTKTTQSITTHDAAKKRK